MLGNLKDQSLAAFRDINLKGIENLWKFLVELDVDNGTDDLGNLTGSPNGGRAAVGTNASRCNIESSSKDKKDEMEYLSMHTGIRLGTASNDRQHMNNS